MIMFVARKCNFESGHIPDAQVGYLNKKRLYRCAQTHNAKSQLL